MNDFLAAIGEILTGDRVLALVRAAVILTLGLLLARVISRRVGAALTDRVGAQAASLSRRGVFYGLLVLTAATVMHQLDFKLSVLLGAAGILSVAIGFASQTSASNLISGLFLIGERPFSIGDVIRIGGTTGEVLSVDLLSVKIRTYDNLFVRVPNENVIKTEVTNLTRFPIRRYDLQLGVAYKEDLGRIRDILLEVAERNPLCLDDPTPLIIFQGYGESSIDLQVSLWCARENFLALRNSITEEIKRAFDERDVEIPFPHRTLYAGSRSAPLPIELVASS